MKYRYISILAKYIPFQGENVGMSLLPAATACVILVASVIVLSVVV